MLKKLILSFFIFSSSLFADTPITAFQDNLYHCDKGQIALCCVFRNEAVWLKEWLEYHRLIGVDHFYLYNNLSSDEYLTVLLPYIQEGIIELYNYPKEKFDIGDQVIVYNHALDLARGENSWLLIIDTDEFIVPMQDDSLKCYLARHANASGLIVNWQVFGTSYVHDLKPGELLIEKLLYRAPPWHEINAWHKSFVQPTEVVRCHNAHYCVYHENASVYNPSISEIRIHHYSMRTERFLYEVKLPRITKWSENAFNVEKLLAFVAVANSEYDDSIVRFVAPLKQILDCK